jgi:hypothetical protein
VFMKSIFTRNLFSVLILLLSVSIQSAVAQCPTSGAGVTVVNGNNNSTYNLNSGNILVIASGTFTGSINFNGAATICIASNATFNGSNMNNFGNGSVINNYGSVDIQNSLSLNGGTVNNYGYLRLRNNPNQNGAVTFVNAQGSYWQFDQAFTLQNSSTFTNNGHLHAAGDFSTNAGTTFTNNFRVRTVGNFNPAGNCNNYGIVIAVGFININSGDKTINYCRMVSESGFNNNDADTENRGLIWVTKVVTAGQFWWQNNQKLTNSGYIRTTSFQNNANIINTNGSIRIEGGSGTLSRNNSNNITGGTIGDISNAGFGLDVNNGNITATYQNVPAYDTTSQQYITNCSPIYIPATYAISGKVSNDGNGMNDNNVNGPGTNADTILYAQLLNNLNQIIDTVRINANGTYSFSNVTNGTYVIQLSKTPGTFGAVSTTSSLPNNWVSTGEFLGTGNGNDGNVNGRLTVIVNGQNVNNAQFGINKSPIANDITEQIQSNPGGTTQVRVPDLTGFDLEDGNYGHNAKLQIITLPNNATLYYDGKMVIALQIIENYNPNLLTVDPTDDAVSVSFKYAFIDAANIASNEPGTVTMPFELTVLPVELIYFNVSKSTNTAVLEWATASEKNNSKFIIWRSQNGVDFEAIGEVAGNGNSAVLIEYSFIDNQPLSGINYYRLEQVDYDGQSENSPIRSVEFDATSPLVQLYPNPFVANIQISGLNTDKSYVLRVFAMTGQLVLTSQLYTTNSINLQELSSRTYLISIIDSDTGANIHTQKLIRK